LDVDPLLNAHLANRLDVSGARTETQPVKHVDHLLILRELRALRTQAER
jgi:hypothetical protein